MDISQMSEEEQLQAAMQLSLQTAGLNVAQSGPRNNTAAHMEPCGLPQAGGTQARRFHGKEQQDMLIPPSRLSAKKQRGEPRLETSGVELLVHELQTTVLMRILFGERPEVQDVERWFNVGFQFSPLPGIEWGLWQKHGGPCGVFAPVQAFIIKHLLFGGAAGNEAFESETVGAQREQPLRLSKPDEEEGRPAVLAYALASVLFQASSTSSYVICQLSPQAGSHTTAQSTTLGWSDLAGAAAAAAGDLVTTGGAGLSLTGRRVTRVADAQQLLEQAADAWLAGPCGVLSFICSLILTRSLDTLREDMDDPSSPLIGRFGHCSQELVNLMLIGEATSNVFDGSRWLGDDPSSGLLVKGVDGDRIGVPPIGFLSELEPLRYLAVGSLYKHPEYPIWVLGSPTHYTLLFSACRADSQLSQEAQLEQRAKKIFVENALDDGGLAMATNLGKMLEALGISTAHLSQAQSQLVREDVVLWEDFRAWACKHFGVADAPSHGATTAKRLKLFLYDGQDPPGPSLKSVSLEVNDIDPRFAGGGSEGDAFAATLHTRWANAIVQVQGLAGAKAERGA